MNFLKIIIDKVGTMPLTVGIPVLYAQQEGYFKEAGLNVEVNIFASGAPINEAIAARDLKILVPLGVVAQYMVESYAANYGLTPDDIYEVNMDYAAAYQAFITGEGDLVALNPPYSYTALAEGYVKLCSLEDATRIELVDGCFAPSYVVEKRPEDIQLFINCLVKAIDALQDKALRTEFTRKVYADNAINCSDEELANEINDRKYIGTEYMKADGFKLGECWVPIAEFLVKAEKIFPENEANVATSINPKFVSGAVGVEIK